MGERKDILEEKMCKELETLEEKYRGGSGELSETDVKKIDMLYHALKSKATYEAMKESGEYGMSYASRGGYSGNGGYSGYSGYSGRNSRDMGPGNSGRYSRDMGPGYSGHYPVAPMPYYYDERQW